MERLHFSIASGESVGRWQITDVTYEPFLSPRKTFHGEINLDEGYKQIVYPVREAFWEKGFIKEREYYNGAYPNTYFPFENNRVDFSTFLHNPHYIHMYARCMVEIDHSDVYEFELRTCGGMKIWVDGKEAALFTPYTRNIPGKTTITLPLEKGIHEICIFADELAERDVFFYYELRYLGCQQTGQGDILNGFIEVEEPEEKLKEAEEFLVSCYFPRDLVTDGELQLCFEKNAVKEPLIIYLERVIGGSPEQRKQEALKAEICPGMDQVSFGPIEDLGLALGKVEAVIYIGTYRIPRVLFVDIQPEDKDKLKPAATIAERKRQALEYMSNYGVPHVMTTLAILESQQEYTDAAAKSLEPSMRAIEKMEDCADFYLSSVMMMKIRYGKLLPRELHERIDKAVLVFRYWIDEPGNDVMWYFSENHAMLFHLAQYLGGWMYQDQVFEASGRSGKEQYEIGKQRLLEWYETFFQYGYAEWNSATYIPVDYIGFFLLYDMAPDDELRTCAKRALDFTFHLIANNLYYGAMSSSYGRAYEGTVKNVKHGEISLIQWITAGEGYWSAFSRASVLYCLSDYLPPSDLEQGLSEGEGKVYQLDQGIKSRHTYRYAAKDYSISSIRRFEPFCHGHQQHVMQVSLGERAATFFVNHPGERMYSGENRPSYWAGNGTLPFIEQYRNIMVMVYKVNPEELVDYIHAYTPFYDYDEYQICGKWLFIRSGSGYCGVWFDKGFEMTVRGANTRKEITAKGREHVVIVKCGSRFEFGNFGNFIIKMTAAEISADTADSISWTDPQYGEVILKDLETFTVGGREVSAVPRQELFIEKGTLPKCLI